MIDPDSGNGDFPRHLTSVRDLRSEQIDPLFRAADEFSIMPVQESRKLFPDAVLGVMFFQPSTRTRLGFEAAAHRLGAHVLGFADPATSRSVEYTAESLEDTAHVVGNLCDIAVIRHFVHGAARRAASACAVPLINGGDGSNEHPTQALSDVWLMQRRLGGIAGLVVGVIGDPSTRVFRSLLLLLAGMNVGKVLFLVPPVFDFSHVGRSDFVHTSLPGDIERVLTQQGVCFEFRSTVEELLEEADVIEMMPIDIPSLEADPRSLAKQAYATPERFRLTAEKIEATHSKAIVLHPGPRSDELHPDTDRLDNSLYFQQASDSVHLRMAVMAVLLRGRQQEHIAPLAADTAAR
ncbi:aspartate carbamoyltransferase [Streptomyces sp. NPDC058255]|uniref:aspartate/ornithine carbamoyltransferase family protein n=1 Tax=Streptomyces sp. NPDC058255 TaxID=3346407 RepID=UPI0036E7ACF7